MRRIVVVGTPGRVLELVQKDALDYGRRAHAGTG